MQNIKQKFILDGAETAIKALLFIAADEERLQRFMDLTGVDGNSIRESMADIHFLQAVYDYLLSDEPLLLDFSASISASPEHVVATRQQLGGNVEWSE